MADKYQIPFINACIRALAKRVGLPVKNAFQYLDRFKGMDFLVKYYPTLHLQSLEDTVDDLIVVCKSMEEYWDETKYLSKACTDTKRTV